MIDIIENSENSRSSWHLGDNGSSQPISAIKDRHSAAAQRQQPTSATALDKGDNSRHRQ
jgi:hypothetical protein